MDRLPSLFAPGSGSGEAGRNRWGFGSRRLGEAGHQQVTFISDPDGTELEDFQSRTSIAFGILQILIGIFYMTVYSISIGKYPPTSDEFRYWLGPDVSGHGIWNGTMFVITGSFGVCAGKSRTKCKIVAFMILCIVSAVMTIIGLCIGALELSFEVDCPSLYLHADSQDCTYMKAISSFYVFLTVCEAISAVAGSVICCRVVCCGASGRVTGRLEISRSDIQEGGMYGTTQERNRQAPPYEDITPVDIPFGGSREPLLPPPYSPEDPYSRQNRETTEKSFITTMDS